MKLSISLGKAKLQQQNPTPSLKRHSAFGLDEDDDTLDAAPTFSATSKAVDANKQLLALAMTASKNSITRKKEDEDIFQYDEVYDQMQEAKLRRKMAQEQESKERKPKYIGGLLASAEQRKLDHLRAEQKMMQLERDAEGDEFNDKEAFVTQGYKEQLAKMKEAEEEEKLREAQHQRQGTTSTGLAFFYQKLLNENEEQHAATVAATQKPVYGPQMNLTITKPIEKALSDAELASRAQAEGKEVELNDDGQIVDKRELLAAGLNLSAPNTRRLGLSSQSKDTGEPARMHTAVGTAASRREINERRAREIQRQVEDERERTNKRKLEAEAEAVKRVVLRRNDDTDVRSARERYLQRKAQKNNATTETGSFS